MDFYTRALITFDGSIHLRAARALSHLQGKVISICMPWQNITYQQTYYSTVLCHAPIYFVLKTELSSLIDSFQQQNASNGIDTAHNGIQWYTRAQNGVH